jgi:hypothetical protein
MLSDAIVAPLITGGLGLLGTLVTAAITWAKDRKCAIAFDSLGSCAYGKSNDANVSAASWRTDTYSGLLLKALSHQRREGIRSIDSISGSQLFRFLGQSIWANHADELP